MRPLAVLILVLGAVAALLFALFSLFGPSAGGGVVAASPATTTAPADAAVDQGPLQPPVAVVDPASAARAEVPDRVEVDAPRGGSFPNSVEGVVQGPDGRPVAGALVNLVEGMANPQLAIFSNIFGDAPAAAMRNASTDEKGNFKFRSVPPGKDYGLIVTHDEFSRSTLGGITVPEEGVSHQVVTMELGYGLRGVVRDAVSAEPIEGAALVLDNPIYSVLPSTRKSPDRMETRSAADGTYHFTNVPAGNLALTCAKEGYATQIHSRLFFTGEETQQVKRDCNLEEAQVIAGRVVGPDRKGVKGVQIDAISHQSEISSRGTAYSQDNGEFLIPNLGEGAYTLKVTAQGWDSDPVPRIEAGDTNVLIQLSEQGIVLGRMIDRANAKPVPTFAAKVRAVHPTNRAYGQIVAQDSFKDRKDGSFQLGGIPQGTYVVQGDAAGYASSFSEPFSITQGLTTPDIVVTMSKGGTLKGQVLDAYSGDPVPGARVTTRENNWIDSEFTNLISAISGGSALTRSKVTTDAQGRFEIPLVTPSDYQVVIEHPSYTKVVRNNVTVSDSVLNDLGVFRLMRGGTVRGTVYGSDGRPTPGASVSLTSAEAQLMQNVQVRTDENGRFVFTSVGAGNYKLSASRAPSQKGSPFDMIIDMKNSEVDITVIDGREYSQDLYMGES